MVALRKKDSRKPSAPKADATARAEQNKPRDAAHEAKVKRQLEIAERIMERDKNILAALAK